MLESSWIADPVEELVRTATVGFHCSVAKEEFLVVCEVVIANESHKGIGRERTCGQAFIAAREMFYRDKGEPASIITVMDLPQALLLQIYYLLYPCFPTCETIIAGNVEGRISCYFPRESRQLFTQSGLKESEVEIYRMLANITYKCESSMLPSDFSGSTFKEALDKFVAALSCTVEWP